MSARGLHSNHVYSLISAFRTGRLDRIGRGAGWSSARSTARHSHPESGASPDCSPISRSIFRPDESDRHRGADVAGIFAFSPLVPARRFNPTMAIALVPRSSPRRGKLFGTLLDTAAAHLTRHRG